MADATSGQPISREERFKSLEEAKYPVKQIPKVPVMLRDTKDFAKYFEPRVVSIGPYHHSKRNKLKPEETLKPAETLKLQFTKQFIDGKEVVKKVYDNFLEKIKSLRNCYDEEPTKEYSDEALAWMLFVDGCAVLHYMEYSVRDKLNDLGIKDHHAAFIQQDLFLLENQLPFQVLEELMSAKYNSGTDKGMEIIEKFIQKNFATPATTKHNRPQGPMEEHSHLLDLLRKRLIDPCMKKPPNSPTVKGPDWESFRNIAELTAVGIKLKPSPSNCLTDVSFKSGLIYGYLNLPPITVDDSTRPKFMNLIAYEMSPGVESKLEITSYICLLDSLIDHADDVKQLRKMRIVHNFLGSDEEVAQVFNEISTDLVPNSDSYKGVKRDIQKHCTTRYKCRMAELFHDHFSSPWTAFAFVVAVIAIGLALVQTYFAINGSLPGECDRRCKFLNNRPSRRGPYI